MAYNPFTTIESMLLGGGAQTTPSLAALIRAHQQQQQQPSIRRGPRQQRQQQQQQYSQSNVPQESTRSLCPTTEMSENDQCIRLCVDLPGVLNRDLEVSVQHGVLSINGIRRIMSVDNSFCTKKYKFARRYAIDTDVVDITKVTANLTHGVLTIRAPKKSRRPQNVTIEVTEHADNNINQQQTEDRTTTTDVFVDTDTGKKSDDRERLVAPTPSPISSCAPVSTGNAMVEGSHNSSSNGNTIQDQSQNPTTCVTVDDNSNDDSSTK